MITERTIEPGNFALLKESLAQDAHHLPLLSLAP